MSVFCVVTVHIGGFTECFSNSFSVKKVQRYV